MVKGNGVRSTIYRIMNGPIKSKCFRSRVENIRFVRITGGYGKTFSLQLSVIQIST